jgi:hypothetical protein
MANVKTPSQQNALAAAAGNPELLELLQSLLNTVNVTQTATNTTGKNVPSQASAEVSLLNKAYVVQITNPGASSPVSTIQKAQQTQGASLATTIQPVTPILHQIRCATSPGFAVNDNIQTFGGDTGSTQTYWTITSLGTGNFYFQIRSSYDGVSWNQWKNANGGQSITSNPSEVTVESATNSDWALLSLPGNQLVGFMGGFAHDTGAVGIPSGLALYSSALLGIVGPNGYDPNGNGIAGLSLSDLDIVVPADTSGTVGIPDYPVQIRVVYQSSGYISPGSGNIFGFAFDPAGMNITRYTNGTTTWAEVKIPGGARIAIGQGKNNHGETIWAPPVSWFNASRMMSICSLTDVPSTGHIPIEGYFANQLSSATVQAQYQLPDGTAGDPQTANWFAVAWELGVPVQTVSGGKFLSITLPGNRALAIGAGRIAAGNAIALPTGFTSSRMISIATPASTTHTGNHLRGVQRCALLGLLAQLAYTDNANTWDGDVHWMVACWK